MFDLNNILKQAKSENSDLFKEGFSISEYSNKIQNNAEFISFFSKGKLEGFIAFYLGTESVDFSYITFIYVAKEFRGQGIAGRLIDSALAKIESAGLISCQLEVGNNNNAKILYEKKGFTTITELKESFIMEKVIINN